MGLHTCPQVTRSHHNTHVVLPCNPLKQANRPPMNFCVNARHVCHVEISSFEVILALCGGLLLSELFGALWTNRHSHTILGPFQLDGVFSRQLFFRGETPSTPPTGIAEIADMSGNGETTEQSLDSYSGIS